MKKLIYVIVFVLTLVGCSSNEEPVLTPEELLTSKVWSFNRFTYDSFKVDYPNNSSVSYTDAEVQQVVNKNFKNNTFKFNKDKTGEMVAGDNSGSQDITWSINAKGNLEIVFDPANAQDTTTEFALSVSATELVLGFLHYVILEGFPNNHQVGFDGLKFYYK